MGSRMIHRVLYCPIFFQTYNSKFSCLYCPIVVVAIAQQPTVDLLLSVGVRAAPVAKVGWIR